MANEGNTKKNNDGEDLKKIASTNSYISESDLADAIKNNAVKKFYLFENTDESFKLVVTLTWKEGYFCLATLRKQPRAWASLHTVALHLKKLGVSSPLVVYLNHLFNDVKEGEIQ